MEATAPSVGLSRPSHPRRLPAWVAHGVIVVGGVIVFVLLAWGHLGLEAWVFPPPPTATRQVATAGPYQVTLVLDAGQFAPGTHNSATVLLRDATRRTVEGATIRAQPQMTTMAMDTPAVTGIAQGGGRYIVHPIFSMAGKWRLDITITRPGRAEQHASFHVSFDANVRWS